MEFRVPVIIPVYNQPVYTEVCLERLLQTDSGFIWPIIVASGCRPHNVKKISEYMSGRGRIVEIDRNRGYAFALNRGLEAIPKESDMAPYVALLHNDAFVTRGWLDELIACLEVSGEEAVVAVPRTNYANEGSPCIQELRAKFEAVKRNNKARTTIDDIRKVLNEMYPSSLDAYATGLSKEEPRFSYMPEVSSFCMLVRSEVFESYPRFDEDFYLRGYEDKLWFLPMERDGLVCMLANRAFVHHNGNTSSDGPGFNFEEGMRINEAKFKEKVRVINENPPNAEDV